MRVAVVGVALLGCSEVGFSGKDVPLEATVDTAVASLPAALEVDPRVIDFGEVALSERVEASITLTNVGGSSLVVGASGLIDDERVFTLDAAVPLELGPGEAQVVPVTFEPTRGGNFEGSAWFESDVEGAGIERVELLGRTAPGDIHIEPAVHDFGSVGVGSRHAVEVSVSNVGEGPLAVESVAYTSTDSRWLFLSDEASLSGAVLAPGERRQLEVTFAPEELGGWEGRVTVVSDDPDEAEADAVQSGLATCSCPDGWVANAAGTRCLRRVEEPALFVGEPWEVCQIEPYFTYGNLGARYPDDYIVQDPYWGQNDGVPNGRLNEVGIWGCIPGTEIAGHDPVGEWVGFQVCLELDDTGTYVTGMGADNRFRLVVDGVTMWEEDTGLTSAFNYWWMVPMELEAGEHIVELWGKNDGSIAGLGVEIYGPFDPAAVSDGPSTHALPLADNRVWSTLDALGSSFEVGGGVGWYCPDEGMILDLCDDEPLCVIDEEMDCPA